MDSSALHGLLHPETAPRCVLARALEAQLGLCGARAISLFLSIPFHRFFNVFDGLILFAVGGGLVVRRIVSRWKHGRLAQCFRMRMAARSVLHAMLRSSLEPHCQLKTFPCGAHERNVLR